MLVALSIRADIRDYPVKIFILSALRQIMHFLMLNLGFCFFRKLNCLSQNLYYFVVIKNNFQHETQNTLYLSFDCIF